VVGFKQQINAEVQHVLLKQ